MTETELEESPDHFIQVNSDERKITVTGRPEKDFWKAMGVKRPVVGQVFMNQVLQTQWAIHGEEEDRIKAVIGMFEGYKPNNELEASLVAQMISVHSIAMEMSRRALLKDQTVEGVDDNLNRATKFMNLFIKQTEALQKLQGKGQQRITVKHVNVSGGQAIVGDVHQGGGANG